jgi:hypothetical protein
MSQSYDNHAYRPNLTIAGYVFLVAALVAFGLRWLEIGGRAAFALGLLGLVGALATVLAISRIYTTRLQDRIIKLEMHVRTATVLTAPQQSMLRAFSNKQITALRFASDQELPALVERTARENMTPDEIKRAVRAWVPDLDRT